MGAISDLAKTWFSQVKVHPYYQAESKQPIDIQWLEQKFTQINKSKPTLIGHGGHGGPSWT